LLVRGDRTGRICSNFCNFSSKLLTRDTEPVRITDFPDATKQIASSFGKNDLEMVATAHFPEVAAAVEWLSRFGSARMTGSGACVFCAFEHEHQADEVLKQLPSRWIGWKAKAMQEHPRPFSAVVRELV
jgi:4-diphosphocytidyl-2-C-methyl-D-erythritol kinase